MFCNISFNNGDIGILLRYSQIPYCEEKKTTLGQTERSQLGHLFGNMGGKLSTITLLTCRPALASASMIRVLARSRGVVRAAANIPATDPHVALCKCIENLSEPLTIYCWP